MNSIQDSNKSTHIQNPIVSSSSMSIDDQQVKCSQTVRSLLASSQPSPSVPFNDAERILMPLETLGPTVSSSQVTTMNSFNRIIIGSQPTTSAQSLPITQVTSSECKQGREKKRKFPEGFGKKEAKGRKRRLEDEEPIIIAEIIKIVEPFETTEEEAKNWTVKEVATFVQETTGFSEYADEFQSQNVDGKALMSMDRDHFTNAMYMKLGPAIKLIEKIKTIKRN